MKEVIDLIKEILLKIYKVGTLKAFLIIVLLAGIVFSQISRAINQFNISKAYYKKVYVGKSFPLTKNRFKMVVKRIVLLDYLKFTSPRPSKDSPLKSLFILVKPEDIQKLNADLPESGKNQWIKGYLKSNDNSGIKKIKLRYRGSGSCHWLFPQKSMKIKIKSSHLWNMAKTINLRNSAFKDSNIVDALMYDDSRSLGILSLDCENVRVFLNGEYQGVYEYLSQPDESFLRRHKRMPGSIYGEKTNFVAAQHPNFKTAQTWVNYNYWGKLASRNAEQKEFIGDIKLIIKAIKEYDDIEFYEFVNTFLNKEAYYNYLALNVIYGTHHHSYTHNHLIYFDPYKGKFEPIQLDVSFILPFGKKDLSNNQLIEKIKLNPVLESERDLVAYKDLDFISPERYKKEFAKDVELLKEDLKSDYLKDHAFVSNVIPIHFSYPYTIKEMEKTLEQRVDKLAIRRKFIKKIYDDCRVRVSKQKNNVKLEVNGNSSAEISFNNTVKVYRDTNFNGVLDKNDYLLKTNKDIAYPGRQFILGNPLSMDVYQFGYRYLEPAPLYYSYIVIGNDVEISAKNYITKNNIKVTNADFKMDNTIAESIHPWKLPQYNPETITLSGVINVNKDLEFKPFQTVIIKPGTRFLLQPNKSIYFYGKVLAQGTKTNPIRFIRARNKPWGIVAVQGQKASGSTFEHVIIDGGSIATKNLINYPGQFDIHDVSSFRVAYCLIQNNSIGDDNMHVAYSKGIIENNIIKNSKSDALDMDIVEVTVKNNKFINAGNDIVDLMTSKVIITDNLLVNSGDKGISVGEWSEGTFDNNVIKNCVIAMEIKDKSVVTVEDTVFVESKEKALNLYNKNMRYDEGGTFNSKKLYVVGNNKIKVDKKSQCNIDEIIQKYPEKLRGLDAK